MDACLLCGVNFIVLEKGPSNIQIVHWKFALCIIFFIFFNRKFMCICVLNNEGTTANLLQLSANKRTLE